MANQNLHTNFAARLFSSLRLTETKKKQLTICMITKVQNVVIYKQSINGLIIENSSRSLIVLASHPVEANVGRWTP